LTRIENGEEGWEADNPRLVKNVNDYKCYLAGLFFFMEQLSTKHLDPPHEQLKVWLEDPETYATLVTQGSKLKKCNSKKDGPHPTDVDLVEISRLADKFLRSLQAGLEVDATWEVQVQPERKFGGDKRSKSVGCAYFSSLTTTAVP
jgi:hypothetical protein